MKYIFLIVETNHDGKQVYQMMGTNKGFTFKPVGTNNSDVENLFGCHETMQKAIRAVKSLVGVTIIETNGNMLEIR